MTDIEWGAEIAVNGVRPEWLRRDDRVAVGTEFSISANQWYGRDNSTVWYGGEFAKDWVSIRLPANHPYYKATSLGFTYWPGGESAPADYGDGVLFADGAECNGRGWVWGRNEDGSITPPTIIGYRKRTEQPAPAIAPELVERMVALLQLCRDVICAGPYADEARDILAELEPDPDLTLAKSIVGDAEAIALAIKAARENGR